MKFNLIPSGRDNRDHLYRNVKAINTNNLPSEHYNYVKEIFDQGQIGSCGWNAIVYAMMADNYKYGYVDALSRLYGYARTKQIDGIPTEGIRIRDGLDIAVKQGSCLEALYPYTDSESAKNLVFPTITEDMDADARSRKCKGYARLNTLEEVKAAIVHEGGVVVGLTVTDSFLDSEHTGFIGKPCGRLLGAHAMYVDGYSDSKEISITYTDYGTGKQTTQSYVGGVRLPNSYGTKWGDKGYTWIPYDCFDLGFNIPFVYNLVAEAWTLYDLPKELNPKAQKEIKLQVGNTTALVNGQPVPLDVAPRTEDSRMLVPIRFVSEQLDCEVSWDNLTQTATIIKGVR